MVAAPASAARLGDGDERIASRPTARILLVENDGALARVIQRRLRQSNFHFETVQNPVAARHRLDAFGPDLVLLDLDSGDSSGYSLISSLRASSAVQIVAISSRATEEDAVTALNRGADDFLAKPLGLEELTARIRVALRRVVSSHTSARSVVHVGALRLDFEHRKVERDRRAVHLTPTEYRLLELFGRHPDRFLSDLWLMDEVWGPSWRGGEHILHVYVARLRKKLEPEPAQPQYLITESGVGYRLVTAGR